MVDRQGSALTALNEREPLVAVTATAEATANTPSRSLSAAKLLDCAGIVREYGVSRSVASSWMRQLPKVVRPGGVAKVYVRRDALEKMLRDAETAA